MDTKEIKKLLETSQYDFLRENPKLGGNIILLTLGGSYAYGTNIITPEHESDIDIRGIRLNTANEIFNMACDDKPFTDNSTDTVIYPLQQMRNLLINCNPNTIEILGTRPESLFICTKEAKMIRDNINIFLSQLAFNSFGGYAVQQLRRLENALARGEYPQEKKEEHILATINQKIDTLSDRFVSVDKSNLNIYVDNSEKTNFNKEMYIDINLNHYPLRDLKGMYDEWNCIIRDYDKLNHRNTKKDTEHLLKHSMHLVRLLLMGTEILQGKGVNTYRENDRELLLDIRKGKYSYSEIFEMSNKLDKEFKYAKENSVLPVKPDISKVNELIREINKKMLEKNM